MTNINDMTETEATALIGTESGKVIAFKQTKAYSVWVFENGVAKVMGKRRFGWQLTYDIPAIYRCEDKNVAGGYYFALDNKMEITEKALSNVSRLGRARYALACDIISDQNGRFNKRVG